MVTLLTIVQVLCYQGAALPGIYRIIKRKSSEDCSSWREFLVITGACFQLAAMYLADTAWQIYMSPLTSILSVSLMLGVIIHYRRPIDKQ